MLGLVQQYGTRVQAFAGLQNPAVDVSAEKACCREGDDRSAVSRFEGDSPGKHETIAALCSAGALLLRDNANC